MQVAQSEESRLMILQQIKVDSTSNGGMASGSGSAAGDDTGSVTQSLNLDFLNREEEFGNLIMVGKYAGTFLLHCTGSYKIM